MFVDLARVTDSVIFFEGSDKGGISFRDLEGGAGYDDVRGVSTARPFLAVGAVTEGGYCGLT